MSSDPQHVTTHADDGVALLLAQFKDKPRLEALLRSYLDQVQEIEDALWQLFALRWIDTAEEQQLDDIGELVGQPRNGALDAAYRVYLKARIRVNYSDGRIEQLIGILSLLVDGAPIGAREFYPKAIEFYVDGVTVDPLIIWRDFLEKAKEAATSLRFFFSTSSSATTLKHGSAVGGAVALTNSQRPGSVYVGGVGGGALAGVFG